MELPDIVKEIELFNTRTHGATELHQDDFFVRSSENPSEFIPFKFLKKKHAELQSPYDLVKKGFIIESHDFIGDEHFSKWFEQQFQRKLARDLAKSVFLLVFPKKKEIFHAIDEVARHYQTLRKHNILINGKKFPVQLGEWYVKTIFGLRQKKSTSQRGFDFYLENKRVEVQVHWGDMTSPKGVKVRKSLLDMSDVLIIVYMDLNLVIREICYLDSDYVLRKFSSKGHTIFLKDSDIGQYFFTRSSKHDDKILNTLALVQFSQKKFSTQLSERFQ